MIWLLDQTIHEYSKPREILTDHGSQFYSVRHVESSFTKFCSENGITHILGGIGRPTTLGKIERWFRTHDQEHARFNLHRKFIEYYNYERPHMSLKYNTPAEVYLRDVPNALEKHKVFYASLYVYIYGHVLGSAVISKEAIAFLNHR